jgi:hypothetical protein
MQSTTATIGRTYTPAVPTEGRRKRVRLTRAVGTALGWMHVLPDFLIIGVARGGTTALMSALRGHPQVMPTPARELHYFDSNHLNYGLGWYRRQFPSRLRREAWVLAGHRPAITGENSPFYLAHPDAPARIARDVPEVRLIALLRDPTARAVSHWQLRSRQRLEQRSFTDSVDADLAEIAREAEDLSTRDPALPGEPPDRIRRTGHHRRTRYERYVARGLYLPQVQRWHAAFPREQLLILPSERWFREPLPVMREVCRHLGLRAPRRLPPMRRNTWGTPKPIDSEAVDRLREFYRPHNAALEAYLGARFDWD